VRATGRQEVDGAQVVQSIRQFEHQHPRITSYRQDPVGQGLRLSTRTAFDLVKSGDILDEARDNLTESSLRRASE
jgi:hypothetical protein